MNDGISQLPVPQTHRGEKVVGGRDKYEIGGAYVMYREKVWKRAGRMVFTAGEVRWKSLDERLWGSKKRFVKK